MNTLRKEGIPFTQIPNELINNNSLSLKAKGLYSYLQSKPSGWRFSSERMVEESKDGVDSIKTGLQELEKQGYLKRVRKNDGRVEYLLKYNKNKHQSGKIPQGENPTRGKSHKGKIHQISNKEYRVINSISNKYNSKELQKTETFGNEDINEITSFLKEKIQATPDGTIKENRRFGKRLLDKIKKDYPDKPAVDLVKHLIQLALTDSFHKKNSTSFKYLYYNSAKIIQSFKSKKNNIVKI